MSDTEDLVTQSKKLCGCLVLRKKHNGGSNSFRRAPAGKKKQMASACTKKPNLRWESSTQVRQAERRNPEIQKKGTRAKDIQQNNGRNGRSQMNSSGKKQRTVKGTEQHNVEEESDKTKTAGRGGKKKTK